MNIVRNSFEHSSKRFIALATTQNLQTIQYTRKKDDTFAAKLNLEFRNVETSLRMVLK